MAAVTSGSRLDRRVQPPSQLWHVVSAALRREAANDPDAVPAHARAEIAQAAGAPYIHVIGNEMRRAGWTADRLPGTRDPAGDDHPIWERLRTTALTWEPSADAKRLAALRGPECIETLLRACIYRMAPIIGPRAALDRLYRDADGRICFADDYHGAREDADHCPGELMRQLLDVTFLDWVATLERLMTAWPEMFAAVWNRDALGVDRLIGQRALPPMPFLRQCKNRTERFRALIAIFWELERLFELLHAIGGASRVTISTLRATLGSTSSLAAAIGAGTRTAHYATGAWCHRFSLAQLFDRGADPDHAAEHPHKALRKDGDALAMDEAAGSVSQAALDLIDGSFCTAPPVTVDQRLRPVEGERPAHFFAGRDVRTLAVLFLLEVRQFLGSNQGGRGKGASRFFDVTIDGAIGRLATIITSRICPATASAMLSEVEASWRKKNCAVHILFADLVANPAAWQALYIGPGVKPSGIARRSEALGDKVLASLVRGVDKDNSRFVVNDAGRLGHSLCFRPGAWFDRHSEASMLIARWREADPRYRAAFPGCFDQKIDARALAFCGNVAASLLPSMLPTWQDPHCRAADRMRSRKKCGRPKKG